MAHFAEIDPNNLVTRIVVAENQQWCENNLGGTWIQTSYNDNIRKQYAGIGYTYDAVNDVFIAPQPFASWSLDNNFDWQPPTPRPEEGFWYWDEDSLSWLEQSL